MNLEPTPLPELNAVLHQLVTGARGILGSSLLGAYLQGSFALGDWDAHSDVDFLFVTRNELSNDQVSALQAMHRAVYALPSAWAQHLEGSYFPEAVLREGNTAAPLWYLDNGSQTLEPSMHDNTLVVRWTTREHGVTLFGPEPKNLIPAVSNENLKLEVHQVMRDWGGEMLAKPEKLNTRWYQQFAVLSFCRMLQTLQTGQVHSKREGANWAQEHLEPRWHDLIATAWQEHAVQRDHYRRPASLDEVAQTLAFIEYAQHLASPEAQSFERTRL